MNPMIPTKAKKSTHTSERPLPYLSIVIPVYNEQDNIESLYEEIRSAVDKLRFRYEIIFVDDGSFDQTLTCLRNVRQKEERQVPAYSRTRIIRFSRNFGQTAAMQAGFDHAQGEVIVCLDGDLQNDPRDIPKLLDTLNKGYDVVCGWRRDRQDKTLTRIIPSRVANWLIRKITRVPINDSGCSLKAYRSSVAKAVRLYSDMHRFIPAMTVPAGARVSEVVVNHRPRKYGEAKYGLTRIWKVLFDMITIKMLIHFHERPIRWFAPFSFLFCLLGLGAGIPSILFSLQGVHSVVFAGSTFILLSLSLSLLVWGLFSEFLVGVETKTRFMDSVNPNVAKGEGYVRQNNASTSQNAL